MTTRQSTTLHLSDDSDPEGLAGLAFSTMEYGDPDTGEVGEREPVLEIWGTLPAPDGQVLNAKVQASLPDVRELQAFLNDNFGRGVAKLPESVAGTVQTAINNLLEQGYKITMPSGIEVTRAALLPEYPDTELPGMWEQSDFTGGETDALADAARAEAAGFAVDWTNPLRRPRQCAVIYNGVQCLKDTGHEGAHDMYADAPMNVPTPALCQRTDPHHHMQDSTGVHWVHDGAEADCTAPDNHYPIEVVHATHQPDVDLFQEQAAALQSADANTFTDNSGDEQMALRADAPRFILGPKNAAEQERKRRLKLEMAFDDMAEKYKSDPHNPGAVAALNDAAVALHKREPDNSRVVNFRFDPTSAPVPAQSAQPQSTEPEQLPEAHFAPEPASQPPTQYQSPPFPGSDPGQMTAAQQTWTNNPDGSASFSPIAAEQEAAQAFPCPHQSENGRPCQRPAGHEIELPNRPPTPHVYATIPSMLAQTHGGPVYPDPAVQQQTMPNQSPPPYVAPAQPFQQPHLQAVPDPQTNVAVMSFQEGEPGMPAAPAMPTWQAPQQ